MAENDERIKRIQLKLATLIKNYQSLQKEHLSLINIVSVLRKNETDTKLEIELMKEKVQILKASAGQMSELDQKNFEKRINQYIREIDHCIGMLSE